MKRDSKKPAASDDVETTAAAAGAAEGAVPESSAIADPAPAKQMQAGSGAFVEDEILDAVDRSHPSVEGHPRAGTVEAQNGADWNDPVGRTPADPDFVGQGVDRSVYGATEK